MSPRRLETDNTFFFFFFFFLSTQIDALLLYRWCCCSHFACLIALMMVLASLKVSDLSFCSFEVPSWQECLRLPCFVCYREKGPIAARLCGLCIEETRQLPNHSVL
ncbi:hypothetical protein DPMN_015103 [Dreissena polymorpha]|uniref:Uncharacterized protein n=1 Tax=Dreissena polymorpha TaxID=45954 RepID=A0A9D4ND03_DREPO|nr:hypothetical protein DPMN_015103 [Dreissena polymorpha]